MKDAAQSVLSHPAAAGALSTEGAQPLLHSLPEKLPWWAVSAALHALMVLLMGLTCVCIDTPTLDDSIVICNDCYHSRPKIDDYKRPEVDTVALNTDSRTVSDTTVRDLPRTQLVIDEAFEKSNDHEISDLINHESEYGGSGNFGSTFEDLIGVAGTSSVGTGWGSGGGDGQGNGAGYGNGNGLEPFGNRTGGGHGSGIISSCAPGCTERAMSWLASHQEPDGHWDAIKYGAFRKTDTAVTSLALLTFLGAGHTEKAGLFHDNVKRAVTWLKLHQQANGLIFDQTDAGEHRGIGYPMAMATLAMAEAAGMGNVPDTRAVAQKAVDYCFAHQSGQGSEKGGWRYHAGQTGDTSVSGWYIMALKSAKIANLHVEHSAFEGAINFLDSVEVHDADGTSHYAYRPGEEHADSTHRMSAIGNLGRIFMGAPKEPLRANVEKFVARGGVPEWTPGKVDLYYWYYGALCTFQMDGDVWKKWNDGMVPALAKSQIKTGDEMGSWPIEGAYADEWGRVGQTALAGMCLEVYYRYRQVNAPETK